MLKTPPTFSLQKSDSHSKVYSPCQNKSTAVSMHYTWIVFLPLKELVFKIEIIINSTKALFTNCTFVYCRNYAFFKQLDLSTSPQWMSWWLYSFSFKQITAYKSQNYYKINKSEIKLFQKTKREKNKTNLQKHQLIMNNQMTILFFIKTNYSIWITKTLQN